MLVLWSINIMSDVNWLWRGVSVGATTTKKSVTEKRLKIHIKVYVNVLGSNTECVKKSCINP